MTEAHPGSAGPPLEQTGVWSEVGRLRTVMVCSPGPAHRHLTPQNKHEMLYDELLWVEQARRDHARFVELLRDHDVRVVEFDRLLADVLALPAARGWVLDHHPAAAPDAAGHPELRAWADGLPTPRLAELLIGGLTDDELRAELDEPTPDGAGTPSFVWPPLPNTQYMRDSSAWLFDGVSLNPMQFPVRRPETLLVAAVHRFHPLFSRQPVRTWVGDPLADHGPATLEGGDLMPVGRGTVLAGMGERTSRQGIEQLATALFRAGAAERVVVATLPHAHAVMHLDTVFTFCSQDVVTAFRPVVDGITTHEVTPSSDGAGVRWRQLERPFVDVVAGVLGLPRLRVVAADGDAATAVREQWDCGNNVFALRPGVVMGYDRNVATNRALRAAGIEVVEVPGGELSRGRGGARCMTCPIERDPT